MVYLSSILASLLVLSAALGYSQVKDSSGSNITSYIDSLNNLSEQVAFDSPDSAILLAKVALKEAKKSGYKKGIDRSFLVITSSYRILGEYDTARFLIDSLLLRAEASVDSMLMASGLYLKARLLSDLGEFDRSLNILKRVLSIRSAIGAKVGLADTYNIMGNTYADLGYYDQALNVYQEALKIDEALEDRVGLASRYNNIARIYTFTEEYQKALQNYQKAYDLAVLIGSETDQAFYSNNLAYLLKLQGRYNEALIFLFKAIKIYESKNADCGKMYPLYNIGSIYMETGKLDSADYYLNTVLPQTLVCDGDQYLRCLILIDLGKMHIKKGQLSKGKDYLLSSFNNAQKYKLPAQALSASQILSEVYETLGETDKSLGFFRNYHALYDSMNNSQNTKRLARIEAKYEYEQKQQQDSLNMQVKRLESEQQLASAISMRNSFIVGFILLGFITVMIFINYKRKLNANAKLSELNKKIILQKSELENQAEELRSANEEITRINENLEQIVNARTTVIKEQNKKIVEYVYYNSHKVRGPLARILGLVALFERNGISPDEMQEKLGEIKKEAVELDSMVRQMNRSLEKQKESLNN